MAHPLKRVWLQVDNEKPVHKDSGTIHITKTVCQFDITYNTAVQEAASEVHH